MNTIFVEYNYGPTYGGTVLQRATNTRALSLPQIEIGRTVSFSPSERLVILLGAVC